MLPMREGLLSITHVYISRLESVAMKRIHELVLYNVDLPGAVQYVVVAEAK